MAESEIVVPGAGPGDTVAVPPYEDKSHIRVAKGIVDRDESLYEWTGPQEITLGPGFPAASEEDVRVYRTTPNDAMIAILDPEDGLDYMGANANWTRLLYLVQELKDRGGVGNLEALQAVLQAAIDDTIDIKNDAVGAKVAAESARDGAAAQRALAQIAAGTAGSHAGSAALSAQEAEDFSYSSYQSAVDALDAYTATSTEFAKSVKVHVAQTFTDIERLQGRSNISAIGNLHKVSILTTSNAEFPLDPSTTIFEVELYGAGGGGGGSAAGTAAGACIAGSGGGGGGYCYRLFTRTGGMAGINVSLGAPGAANSGAAGGAGGSSSATYDGQALVANGGAAGGTHTVSGGGGTVNGGVGGTATGGDLNIAGGDGGNSFAFGTADMALQVVHPGYGGSGANGGNTRANVNRTNSAAQSAGRAGGIGGGGSGAYSMNAGTAQAGGAGGASRCIIREYK